MAIRAADANLDQLVCRERTIDFRDDFRGDARVADMPVQKDAATGTPGSVKASDMGYGLGWGLLTLSYAKDPFLFHGGSNGLNYALIMLQPRHDFAMVMVTNIGGPAGEDLTKVVHAKASLAKLFASEAAYRCADRVVQAFGGRGYVRTTAAERFLRELRVDRIWEGTSEIQRLIVSRSLVRRGVPAVIA